MAELPAYRVFRLLGGGSTRCRAFTATGRLGGCAAAKYWCAAHAAEQVKLEGSLHLARQALTHAAGAAAWLEGWDMPVDRAIEVVLMPTLHLLRISRGEKILDGPGRRSAHSALLGPEVGARRRYDWQGGLASGVFLDGRLVRGEVDAVNLVAGYVAMEPLDLGPIPFRTLTDFRETSRNWGWVRFPAPGISRSMTNFGMSLPRRAEMPACRWSCFKMARQELPRSLKNRQE